MCCQDFKDTFVCNTQPRAPFLLLLGRCVVRISKILLYAIHNYTGENVCVTVVVLSGFQRYFCMQYTTTRASTIKTVQLCCQDFKDTFVCNTQLTFCWGTRTPMLCCQDFKDTFVCNTQPPWRRSDQYGVVLSGFQRYFCMQYTTAGEPITKKELLCCQDFKDTFVCNTQHLIWFRFALLCCVVRISKILLYAIHNTTINGKRAFGVVLSGFQRYFCMQYTTAASDIQGDRLLCCQDFKDTFVCNTQHLLLLQFFRPRCVVRISKIL